MNMKNAKAEIVEHVGERRVAYGCVYRGRSYYSVRAEVRVTFISHEQYLAVLPALDFEYDGGYGGQELYGAVVFEDGTWLERGEYDGREWWEHKECPTATEVIGLGVPVTEG